MELMSCKEVISVVLCVVKQMINFIHLNEAAMRQ